MALMFENKITIGNVLTVAGMAAGMFWSYSQLTAEQARQAHEIAAVTQAMRDRGALADADRAAKDARIRALEVGAAGLAADLRNIQSGINDIKASIAVLTQRVGRESRGEE